MILEFSSMNSLKTCLKMGIGITLCPEIFVRQELLTKELERFGWRSVDTETSVIMIWHAQKWCSPLLNQFLNLSEELISD